MTPTSQIVLIAIVFASQLLVMSFLVPRSFRRSLGELVRRCPPERYPRLYPVSPERMQRISRLLGAVNIAAGAGGAAALVVGLWRHIAPAQLADWLIWTTMAQLAPALLRSPWQMHIARALRAMPAPSRRSAELRPTQITDFVPSPLIASGLIAVIMAMIGALLLWRVETVARPLIHLYVLGIGTLLLIRMLYVLFSGAPLPRPDPYMSNDDVFRARRLRLRVLFGASTILGLYFSAMQVYVALREPFPVLYVAVASSLLTQLLYLRAARRARNLLLTRDLAAYEASPT
jgi:hypothetical protein